MKKLFLTVILLAPVAIQAQPSATAAPNDRAASGFVLSAGQKAQIEPIREKYRKELQDVLANKTLTPKEKNVQIKAFNNAYEDQFVAILTPEQKMELDKGKQTEVAKKPTPAAPASK